MYTQQYIYIPIAPVSYASIICITTPYVAPTQKNNPKTTRKICSRYVTFRSSPPFQKYPWSYSHSHPGRLIASGAKQTEPTSAIRYWKIGIAEARTKASAPRRVVQAIQVAQWVKVLACRCLEVPRIRTKTYFAPTY